MFKDVTILLRYVLVTANCRHFFCHHIMYYYTLITCLEPCLSNTTPVLQNQSVGQYAAAGGLATEALGAVRTVTALNAQPAIITKYRKFLLDAMQVM